MRKSRFSDEQIIAMIREHESGVKTADICRKYGLSDATFYKLKAKFGGMTVSDAQRLRTLETENGKLKRLLAEAMLDSPEDHKSIEDRFAVRIRRAPPCGDRRSGDDRRLRTGLETWSETIRRHSVTHGSDTWRTASSLGAR